MTVFYHIDVYTTHIYKSSLSKRTVIMAPRNFSGADPSSANRRVIVNTLGGDRSFLLLLLYLLFLPIASLCFHLLLRYMRRRGFVERETAEALLRQCHSVLLRANDSYALSSGYFTKNSNNNNSDYAGSSNSEKSVSSSAPKTA